MRVLVTTQPGQGHLQPMAPYAKALLAAGDEVKVATAASFGPAVEKLGLEPVAVGTDFTWERPARKFPALADASRTATLGEVIRAIVWDHWVPQAVADLQPVVASWQPHLILRESSEHAGTFAARLAGIPTAVAAWGAVATDPAWELIVIPDSVMRRCWVRQAEALGLSGDVDDYLDNELTLSCLPASWIPADLAHVPPVHHFRMPPLDGATADDEGWGSAGGERPLVYATLGTVFGWDHALRDILLEAFAGLDIDVVMTIGRGSDAARIAAPGNVRVAQYVPQSLLLPQASAVVSHAGLGTMIGAIAAGVPMVLIDLGADHVINAGRAAALGIAETFKRDALDAEALRAAIARILDDPGPRRRAAALAEEYAQMPPAADAVAILRDHAAAGV